jgi:MFS family permease
MCRPAAGVVAWLLALSNRGVRQGAAGLLAAGVPPHIAPMPEPTSAHATPPSPPVAARLGRNVVALGVVSLLTDASSEMIYPLLPLFLTTTLGASAAAVGAIEGAAETTAALLKLASGWWSDRVRRRKPLVVAGYALASIARPLVAIATSAAQVLAIRLTDRVGKGIRSSPRDALIADSVPPALRGRAFGLHRAMDHAGAVVGPLVAWALLRSGVSLRTVFWLAAIPAALAVLTLVVAVREGGVERGGEGDAARDGMTGAGGPPPTTNIAGASDDAVTNPAPRQSSTLGNSLPRRFWAFLAVLLVFTLGNSTDAFLLLRATQLGVAAPLIPILWALLHVVKSAASTPGGALSDRVGRRPLLVAGWLLFALVYLGFARAGVAWHAWALFALYGVHFGLVEGAEKALVADLVPADRRGTAFGWYNLAIGLAALPASVLFGIVWTRFGAPTAFGMGSVLALVAAAGVFVVLPRRAAA